MSFLREPGDLARTPLAAILLEAWNLRLTGELTVHQAGGDSRLFFRDGVPVGAQTFAGFHPLGQILLGQGVIDIETLGRSLAEMASTGRRQGEVLVEMGAVPQEVVDRALEDAAGRRYVSLIAGARRRRLPVRSRRRRSRTGPDACWSRRCGRWSTRWRRRRPRRSCQSALARAEGTVALGSGYADLESSFSWTEPEAAAVRRARDRRRPRRRSWPRPASPATQARAVLAALLLLGLAEPAGEVFEMSSLGAGSASPVPRTRFATGSAGAGAPKRPRGGPGPPAAVARPGHAEHGRGPVLGRTRGRPPAEAASSATAASSAPTPAEREIRRALEAALPLARDTDLFARLGLPRGATTEDVKGAYLRLVKQFHPDRYGSPALADLQGGLREVLSALNEAYATLSDRSAAHRLPGPERLGWAGRDRGRRGRAARADFQKGEAARRTGDHARARLFFESAVRSDRRADYLVGTRDGDAPLRRAGGSGAGPAPPGEAMKDPTCSRAFLVAGIMARDDGEPDRAEKLFRAALKANPRNEEAARELHEIQGRRSVRAEARPDAKK